MYSSVTCELNCVEKWEVGFVWFAEHQGPHRIHGVSYPVGIETLKCDAGLLHILPLDQAAAHQILFKLSRQGTTWNENVTYEHESKVQCCVVFAACQDSK